MVAILERTEHNTDFNQIVDFLEASYIRVKTTDGETKILAKVNGRQRTISESSIRRHLKLNDEEEPTIPSQSHSVITTPRRITKGAIRISQSKVASPRADETAFPTGDVRYGEAFPTITRLDSGQDKENIAKTSAMPHEASPRVTSLGGGEDNLKITQLKTRVKTLKDKEKRREGLAQVDAPNTGGGMDQREDLLVGDTVKDSDKSADKGSDSTNEMANVLDTLGAANILAKKVLEEISVQLARDLEAKFAQKDQIIKEKAERDSEIDRIHAKRDLNMIIAELDRSNEIVANKLKLDHHMMRRLKKNSFQFGKKMQDFVPMNSKLESERLKRPEIQLGKESFKKWKKAKVSGTEPSQERQSEKELSEEELKKMMHTTEVTDEKSKELWVELKRLYKPDSRDPLWDLQRYMHDPLGRIVGNKMLKGIPTARSFATVEDFALLHEDKIYSESKTCVC
nr:hypothetical protein [Tanacetum cinerariifolium]